MQFLAVNVKIWRNDDKHEGERVITWQKVGEAVSLLEHWDINILRTRACREEEGCWCSNRNHMSSGRSRERRGVTADKNSTPLAAEHPFTEQLMSAASLSSKRRGGGVNITEPRSYRWIWIRQHPLHSGAFMKRVVVPVLQEMPTYISSEGRSICNRVADAALCCVETA